MPCRGCGQILASDESFCGDCGTERISNPDGPLQSKWASLWYMNQARKSAEPESDVAAQASQEDTEHAAEYVASAAELSEAYYPNLTAPLPLMIWSIPQPQNWLHPFDWSGYRKRLHQKAGCGISGELIAPTSISEARLYCWS